MSASQRRSCCYCSEMIANSVRITIRNREKWLNLLGLVDNGKEKLFLCPSHFLDDDIVEKTDTITKVKPDCSPIVHGIEVCFIIIIRGRFSPIFRENIT